MLLHGSAPTAQELTGENKQQSLIGKKVQDFLIAKEHDRAPGESSSRDARKDFDELLSNKERFTRFDAKIKSDAGKLHDVEFALQFDAEAETFNVSIQDVGDRKAYEENAAYEGKIESVEKLAASLSHDLNNIVGSIIGFAGLLKRKLAPDTKEFHYANIIEDSAKRTTDLVKQVLGFSHLDVREIEVHDLNKLVNDVAAEFTKTHVGKYAIVMTPAGGPAMVKASDAKMKQVIAAILENAAESMENGGVIDCSVNIVEKPGVSHELDQGQKQCVVAIEDHGTGMDEAVKRRIFEPFFTTKREKKYTGLSLSASYNIIKHHNGQILVDSTPAVGTTFRICLPRYSEKEKTKAVLQWSGAAVPKGTKVLVVDDEESFRQLGYDILSEQGYEVITASDGLRALEQLKHDSGIQAVILDMIMPVMGGKETCIEIKKMAHPPKILICTGYSELSDLEAILGTYADALLQKPYSTGDLIAALGKLL